MSLRLGKKNRAEQPHDLTSPLEGKSLTRILITIGVAIAVPGGLYLLAALIIAPAVTRYLIRKSNERGTGGEWDKALANANRAVRLSRGSATALAHRGLVRIELGQQREALDDVSHAIEKNPDVALSYFVRALIHDRAGDDKEALEGYHAYLGRASDGEPTRVAYAQERVEELGG